MKLRLASLAGLACALLVGPARSQEPAPPVPGAPAGAPANAAVEPGCLPACRDGFGCQQQQCVSLCNPACPPDLVCVEGRRCESPATAHSGPAEPPIYEPPPPPSKSFDERSHSLLGFHLGFSGDLDSDGQGDPLASTFGFNLRGDAPVARYVLIGPLVQFGAWRADLTPEPTRNYYVDIDLVLRLRLPITTRSTNFQLWAGVPIGLTFDVLGDERTNVAGMGFGWNVGVLVGGAVHFTPKFGIFSEVGWQQHKFAHEAEVGQDLDLKLAQGTFNVGIVVRN